MRQHIYELSECGILDMVRPKSVNQPINPIALPRGLEFPSGKHDLPEIIDFTAVEHLPNLWSTEAQLDLQHEQRVQTGYCEFY
jgi:hypothetical protein